MDIKEFVQEKYQLHNKWQLKTILGLIPKWHV